VLGTLQCEEVSAPLCDGFLAPVLRGLKTLAHHSDLLHDLEVGAVVLCVIFTRGFYSLARRNDEVVGTGCHAVDQLHEILLVSEGEFKTVCVLLVDKSELIALTYPGDRSPKRDRVESVMVSVEVGLDRPVRIKDTYVGSESGCRLIFRSVDNDFFALPGAGLEREVVYSLGACQ